MAIDIHAHCVPDGLVSALAAGGRRLGVEVLRAGETTRVQFAETVTAPLEPSLSDLPARLAAMDRTGVTRQVLSPFIDLTGYWLDEAAGSAYCRLFNEHMAGTVAQAPDRLSALATVPLQSGPAAAKELAYAVAELGMVGAEIGTDTGRGQLDDKELEPFWAAAAELGCLVFIHPNAAARTRFPYFLGNFVGNPSDTTVAAARLMFGGVLDRHPGLRICLAHGGGFLPYQIGRLDRGFHAYGTDWGAELTSAPRDLATRLHYDTVLHSIESTRLLIDLVGAEQLLLGTDYPFEMGDLDPLSTVAAIPGLDERERSLITHGNAEFLLGL
ncbi:amidohydrolase family protein [Actinocrispum wychmicini]|uniref:Aminocarboxymuconate-semialdehyde decarboxylase n=1 Tax=Actinocrispum wychmicini TaxID=1213861 RepID=A0A4R2J8W1_9PSEU|nr:amidohydrolase family protein [Actinocrispum wychmicini]TCO52279.1 aminocarboxymuconate-semialdehyde decarboxylase [Actinocrispum wychmicini]